MSSSIDQIAKKLKPHVPEELLQDAASIVVEQMEKHDKTEEQAIQFIIKFVKTTGLKE
jgi:sulfite reductase beta subunit-like hemoprotein